ncbi:hypothetical protein K440DRAFT_657723 [Wilcoxina mikolae CBS 423.85]|nr:hypothetical protein K440DRAFT_657723 [Wilcoxina mikolae CBS 423.85]
MPPLRKSESPPRGPFFDTFIRKKRQNLADIKKDQHSSLMENPSGVTPSPLSPIYIVSGISPEKSEEFPATALNGTNQLFEQRIGIVEDQTRVVIVENLSTSDIDHLGQKLECKFRPVPGPGVFVRQHVAPQSPGPKSEVYAFAFDSVALYDSRVAAPSQSLRTCPMNDKNSVNFAPISVYIHENSHMKCNTIIVESHNPKGIAQSLQGFWQVYGSERWDRLRSEPFWIFCDIFAVFSWGPVLGELSSELRIAELRAFQQASRVDHTHSAHRLIGISIELSEAIRVQNVVVEGLKKELSVRSGQSGLLAASGANSFSTTPQRESTCCYSPANPKHCGLTNG